MSSQGLLFESSYGTWKPPASLPNLDGVKDICLDVETFDPGLQANRGPDVFNGYIVGVAVGTRDRQWYLPVRHEMRASTNLNEALVYRWLNNVLKDHRRVFGFNLLYDLEHLAASGVHLAGHDLVDVSLAEPLLDEHQMTYGLGPVSKRRLGEGKDEQLLYEFCSKTFGGKPTRKAQAGNIWRCPPGVVGSYAESDVRLPFELFDNQVKELEEQGLLELFELECRLLPILLAMRRRGVKIDLKNAAKLKERTEEDLKDALQALEKLAGRPVNIWVPGDLAALFDDAGVSYPMTPKTNQPSITVEWLKGQVLKGDGLSKMIMTARKLNKFKTTFLEGAIVNGVDADGYLRPQFHQLKGDENGTISGRFSSSNPNGQNIPARDEELAPLVRGLFIPDEGETWVRADHSQIEYRALLHYAEGERAEEIKEMYRKDPKIDYHALVAEWSGLARKPAKNLNFGVIYGLGRAAMAHNFSWTAQQVDEFLEIYHCEIPFAKPLNDKAMRKAEHRGYIRTILNRRARFPFYEPAGNLGPNKLTARRLEAAKREWPNQHLTRAHTYTALNKLLQGGAADILKKGMVDIWEAGVCDVLGAPLLTVHDELDWSVPDTKAGHEAVLEMKRLMEQAVKLSIPVVVDLEQGPSWGSLKAMVLR